jgi:hypothetical protein
MIFGSERIGIHQVDDTLLGAVREQIAIPPTEKHRTGRPETEIFTIEIRPIRRQKVIDYLQTIYGRRDHRV